MRIPIREQLALLILLAALIGLAVVSVPTFLTTHDFVLRAQGSLLSNIASLKAAQLASNLELMQTGVGFVSTRILLQAAVKKYNEGTVTDVDWTAATKDLTSALSGSSSIGQQILVQSMLFPKSPNGTLGRASLLNATSPSASSIALPYDCIEGTLAGQTATLGLNTTECGNRGFPPTLYPNLTYTDDGTFNTMYDGLRLNATSALLLGPWRVNDTLFLVSVTLPMLDFNMDTDILGWLTFVMDWTLIAEVLNNPQDLGDSGLTLLLGPATRNNLFAPDEFYTTDSNDFNDNYDVRYVIPLNGSYTARHPEHTVNTSNLAFPAKDYPAVISAVSKKEVHKSGSQGNSGSNLRTHNEAGKAVSVGYAVPETALADWVILVELSQSSVWKPIVTLRNILLATIFSTLGLCAIVSFPMAHWSSRPIRRLREATLRSVAPPSDDLGSYVSERHSLEDTTTAEESNSPVEKVEQESTDRKLGFFAAMKAWWNGKRKKNSTQPSSEERRPRQFRIPARVKEHRHWIKDELSDLTMTFNEMADELMAQYDRLEERVKLRTAELELSKKAAEAANESKTLFIANISHELKTPLNGILGMTAVCMQEDDPLRLKRSLGIIYKSGDLLLNLLTDLLTFSKNQVGQQLSLEEKEFLLRDVSSQVLAIFEKQARENKIDLKVVWEGAQNASEDNVSSDKTESGPGNTGKLRNMVLFGDVQRILQVLINLVSNSLKFTPPGGSVVLTIRCLAEVMLPDSRRASLSSRRSENSRQPSISRHRSIDAGAAPRLDTANAINARDRPNGMRYPHERTRSPVAGRQLGFEFEVKDTGPGIPEDIQGKIFEPFVQGDLGLSKKYAGTGLGLSICAQLASLMRGTIGVQSTVGVGSTFKMTIPLRHIKSRSSSSASSGMDDLYDNGNLYGISLSEDEERRPSARRRMPSAERGDIATEELSSKKSATDPAADPQPRLVGLSRPFFAPTEPMESPGAQAAAVEKITADAKRSNKRVRVLVADDNKVNQEVVCRMLKLEDVYDVTVAKDGQEALDLVKETLKPHAYPNGKSDGPPPPAPFNLIFMDVQMPNVDGLESTRLIRACGYREPIVALTAFAEESNIRECLASGMNYFLSKPIRRPQLKKVLNEYIPPIPEESEEGSPSDPPTVDEAALNRKLSTVAIATDDTIQSSRVEGWSSAVTRGDMPLGYSLFMQPRPMPQPMPLSDSIDGHLEVKFDEPVSPMHIV